MALCGFQAEHQASSLAYLGNSEERKQGLQMVGNPARKAMAGIDRTSERIQDAVSAECNNTTDDVREILSLLFEISGPAKKPRLMPLSSARSMN